MKGILGNSLDSYNPSGQEEQGVVQSDPRLVPPVVFTEVVLGLTEGRSVLSVL